MQYFTWEFCCISTMALKQLHNKDQTVFILKLLFSFSFLQVLIVDTAYKCLRTQNPACLKSDFGAFIG